MGKSWFDILSPEIVTLGHELSEKAAGERERGKAVYPLQESIFRALELTGPEDLSVLVLGQDPYHQPLQANGLAFSVNAGLKFPRSLRNIFNELVEDIGCAWPESGDLTSWAKQGVLLLNTSLTVEEGKPNSHIDWGWHDFTQSVFRSALELPQPVVFLLWGRNAQEFVNELDIDTFPNKKVLMSTHPSPFSARRANRNVPAFIGSRPFSAANVFLREMGGTAIDWRL